MGWKPAERSELLALSSGFDRSTTSQLCREVALNNNATSLTRHKQLCGHDEMTDSCHSAEHYSRVQVKASNRIFIFYIYICMYKNLGINKRRHSYCFSFSVNSGTFSNRSPTRPTSATWKMGASASLLMAAMTLLSFIPAKCWMAPEIPAQRYS